MKRIFLALALALGSSHALADCSMKQSWCETQCEVRHFSDEAAELGCKSKCLAQRTVCSTKSGANTALEYGKDGGEKAIELGKEGADAVVETSEEVWEDTKSFVKGLTE